ncbi:MAG: TrkH family potassium uptake protein [Pseudorhizobium sp.]
MKSPVRHPVRLIPLGFLVMVAIGTLGLMLPLSKAGPGGADLLTAFFTAVSAVCVTGLIVVDTATYWTPLGQGIILALIQIGGFGFMAGATLLGLMVSRKLGLRTRLLAQAETRTIALGEVTSVLKLALTITLSIEVAVAGLIVSRLHIAHDEPDWTALWNGIFHSVSAFNNAGFSTYSDSLMSLSSDVVVLGAIMVAVIVGGVGFPVMADLKRNWREPARWTLHTKLTLLGTAILLIVGFVVTLIYEWGNPATIGNIGTGERLLGAMFHSVMTRTAGFNSLDVGSMEPETLMVTIFLMIIGGGSAGTAGGIKVSTMMILALVAWSEVRAEPDAVAYGRRISRDAQRQALTVVIFAIVLISASTLTIMSVTHLNLEPVLFEVVSAFATVGLSTGITADLPPTALLVLIILMFLGRVGTITVATSLALRHTARPYRYPEERPIVG